MLEVLFLGTGASLPSRYRSLPCVAVRHGRDIILFDCGEGSQRQMMISPLSFMKISGIFITHLHGDHILGLPGLLQTMGLSGRRDPLLVCGPEGFTASLKAMMDACDGELEYPLDARDISPGETIVIADMTVTTYATEHNVSSIGYMIREPDIPGRFNRAVAESLGIEPGADYTKLQNGEVVRGISPDMVIGPSRPGCSLAYVGDTIPCESVIEGVRGADVLIHESTYIREDSQLAAAHFHSTAYDVAEVAKVAGCRSLFLIHVSNRYDDDRPVVLAEAQSVFPETYLPEDMEMYSVTSDKIRLI